MALPRLIVVLLLGAALPLLLLFSRAEAGALGVSYGRVANNLPKYAPVVNLLKQNGITMVRIYDADSGVLTALANTGIKVMVMVPNEKVADLASSPSNALHWVRDNVAAYRPSTQIHAVAVGNEVFDSRPDLNSALVPAMTNVQAGLAQLNLAGAVKVTTPLAFSAVSVSWPPAAGKFRDDIAQSVMKPMLDLLQRTGSYLSVNYYPYLTYMAQPESFTLDYVLANNNAGVLDPNSQLRYYNLLDAQRDATYYAMQKLGSFSNLAVHHTEHGAPSGGGLKPGGGGRRLLQTGAVASVANAQTYINNLMNRVLSGKTGTPYRPDADMDVYIFALFNENNKGTGADDVEQHFGLFYPNMTKVYEFDFTHIINGGGGGGGGGQKDSWCVANAAVGDARLKDALDYACGHGADCSSLQPGGSCYEPNTMAAHASYAFNSYYQAMNRAPGACDFNGAASVVYDKPADTCSSAKQSWCVANAAVGDDRLKTALDYACANGADCSAIQTGGTCFQPDTMAAHASYAFNSYYQRKNRASGTCDFSGAASVVYQEPALCAATVSWCVANPGVGDGRLKTALDYACGHGADCGPIQTGGACFQPDTMASHASYAFNSYYQRNSRARVACDFSGSGSVVYQQPKVGNCVLPSNG